MNTAPRRILFPYVGDTIGGSHISSLQLVVSLPRDRYAPVVGLHQTDGVLAEYLHSRGMDFIALPDLRLPTMGSLRRQIPVFARSTGPLGRLLREHEVSIVHTNDIRMHQLWGLPARLAGAAHIWHQRTPTRNRRLDSYARLATRVVTISDYCRGQLPPRLARRAEVIANPFALQVSPDRKDCRKALLSELGRDEAGAVIGFVSNFTERKRPLAMVALALALRKRGYANSLFPMFGEARPPLGPELESAIAAAGLTGTVIPMGPRYPIEPWIAGCDLLVAPARREAFGRTLVEAMLCGTPVVASDEGGHREIIRHGETGLLVPPDDANALAQACRALLSHPGDSARMAATAQAEARKLYSVTAHVAAMTAVYDTC